jgi:hypothetical protein
VNQPALDLGEFFNERPLPKTPAERRLEQLARCGDPVESKEAAREIQPRLSELKQRVYQMVLQKPGRTTQELAELFDVRDIRDIGRRLPELERDGRVRRESSEVRCRVSGRKAARWYVKS